MIAVGERMLSVDDMSEILFKGRSISLSGTRVDKVRQNHEFLRRFSSNKLIYGINTGFGPMAQYKVSEENLLALQYNLIRSHSSGGGNLMSPIMVKAVMIARLSSLMQAHSGVNTEVVELLKEL